MRLCERERERSKRKLFETFGVRIKRSEKSEIEIGSREREREENTQPASPPSHVQGLFTPSLATLLVH